MFSRPRLRIAITIAGYSTSQWAAQPAPTIRTGMGDSLGNALFLRQAQIAKAQQFGETPTYASEITE